MNMKKVVLTSLLGAGVFMMNNALAYYMNQFGVTNHLGNIVVAQCSGAPYEDCPQVFSPGATNVYQVGPANQNQGSTVSLTDAAANQLACTVSVTTQMRCGFKQCSPVVLLNSALPAAGYSCVLDASDSQVDLNKQ